MQMSVIFNQFSDVEMIEMFSELFQAYNKFSHSTQHDAGSLPYSRYCMLYMAQCCESKSTVMQPLSRYQSQPFSNIT